MFTFPYSHGWNNRTNYFRQGNYYCKAWCSSTEEPLQLQIVIAVQLDRSRWATGDVWRGFQCKFATHSFHHRSIFGTTEVMMHSFCVLVCTSQYDLLRLDPLTYENEQVKWRVWKELQLLPRSIQLFDKENTAMNFFIKRQRDQNAEPVCLTSVIPVMGKSIYSLLNFFELGCFQKHLTGMGFYDNSEKTQ